MEPAQAHLKDLKEMSGAALTVAKPLVAELRRAELRRVVALQMERVEALCRLVALRWEVVQERASALRRVMELAHWHLVEAQC